MKPLIVIAALCLAAAVVVFSPFRVQPYTINGSKHGLGCPVEVITESYQLRPEEYTCDPSTGDITLLRTVRVPGFLTIRSTHVNAERQLPTECKETELALGALWYETPRGLVAACSGFSNRTPVTSRLAPSQWQQFKIWAKEVMPQ